MIRNDILSATAFAPATSANIAVGFDILGFALDAVGDEVTLTKRDDGQIIIEAIEAKDKLPLESYKNTASIVVEKLCSDLGIDCGFNIKIKKGIALGSGMGGSAASAVAALVALNEFLSQRLTAAQLVYYALFGEELASGQKHADNVAPCVYGGITLTRSINPIDIISLPAPELLCVIIHPHLTVETKAARKILKDEVLLKDCVKQSANLAGFIASLYTNDMSLLKRSLHDVIIEPQRSYLVKGFYEVKEAANHAGALGCSLSGSGPSMFAFCQTGGEAEYIKQQMIESFARMNIKTDSWISSINKKGAAVKNTV